MATELFNNGKHMCLMFGDLVENDDSSAVQANQFLIVDNGHGALIDPGGNITYNSLLMEIYNYFPPRKLNYILASHADPDIIASINKWMVHTECTLMISKLWARFAPHFCNAGNMEGRIQAIPDEGTTIPLGNSMLKAVPAHFMHSEGNFQFYDPVSKILFSGDMGTSIIKHDETSGPVEDFRAHIPLIDGFHRRYMVSNKICRFWVNMVRQHDIEWIVPQHGRSFKGKKMVNEFLNWIENLPCGVDTMTQSHYAMP